MADKNEELKKLKKALKSGNYNKTRKTLKGTLPDGSVGHCCLGVYASLYGYELNTVNGFHTEDGHWKYSDEGNEDVYRMVRKVFENSVTDVLIDVNDNSDNWEPVIQVIDEMIDD